MRAYTVLAILTLEVSVKNFAVRIAMWILLLKYQKRSWTCEHWTQSERITTPPSAFAPCALEYKIKHIHTVLTILRDFTYIYMFMSVFYMEL